MVDRTVEKQFDSSGIVLVGPAYIDELLVFQKRGTRDDLTFILKKRGTADYVLVLPKADVTNAFVELGRVVESPDGSLLIQKSTMLGGEGSRDINGNEADSIYMENKEGAEWLVIETRITWMQRSWFKQKKREYRSLVRFRKLTQ